MWTIQSYDGVSRRLKSYKKKWSHEVKNVFDNLDTLHQALCRGTRPEQLKLLGFVRSEPCGVLAVDQSGPGKGARLKHFRLYVYPDERNKVVHVMVLGDKSTQNNDIKVTSEIVRKLTKQQIR